MVHVCLMWILESLFGRVDSSIGPSSNYHDLHVIPWTPSLSVPRGLEVAYYSAEIEFLIEPFCGFYFVCLCVCVCYVVRFLAFQIAGLFQFESGL